MRRIAFQHFPSPVVRYHHKHQL